MRYKKPGLVTRLVMNPLIRGLVRLGVNVAGSRELVVRGRKSGLPRSTPVNLLVLDGERYLVAPRGHTEWVRNLRAAGEGELRLGKSSERFTAVELDNDAKAPVLRAYLKKWAWEVGAFFNDINTTSPDADLLREGPNHPAFRITTA